MPTTLHIRLLGGFSVRADDTSVSGLNTARLQSLFAYLVLHRDIPELRQHIAFLFWPDSSEAQARNNLRQIVHLLRLALPDADRFLIADNHTLGWRLDAPFLLDVEEFERALAQADSAARQGEPAAEYIALEQADSLYQGDLLPSCYDSWITSERERLRQRHLQVLTRLVALLEARQEYDRAVHYARRIIRDDALNEDAYQNLMRLLVLQGDRAGAARVYHTCASILQRELGIHPSRATRKAYEQLVRGSAGETLAVAGHPAVFVTPTLIGRQPGWEQLQTAWRRANGGQPGFALVTGEAGIGKSRLAEELLLWANQQGVLTAKTRSYAAEGQLSLAPVIEWLRSERLRPHLTRLDSVWLVEVARILPELSGEYHDLPLYQPMSELGQRQRFFQALALAVLAAPPPLLLVIDDLQWCDQETLEWLHFLLRFDSAARLLVVGCARSEELPSDHPLRTLLRHLGNTIGVTEIALQPLDAAETAQLARRLASRELDLDATMRLFRETEGNPLFVVEAMRAGFDRLPGGPERDAHSAGSVHEWPASSAIGLSPRVQAVIAGRLAQLSTPTREFVALAAAIGREFQLDVLAHASNTDEESALRALDELWQRRIVREQGARSYDFTHDKLREVAYAEISAPQRQLVHRRIARALATIHADDLDPVSGQIATQYERAGMSEQAIPFYQRAAAVARSVYANEDAIAFLVRALALLQDLPATTKRDELELSLQLALAPIYRITRGWTAPQLEQVVNRTLLLCDLVGSDAQRAEALYGLQALLVVQGKLEKVQVVADELESLYQRTQVAAPPLSRMMLAGARMHLGRYADARAAFEHVLTHNDPLQQRDLQESQGWNYAVHTRAWQAHTLWLLGYPAQALASGEEAIQLAGELVQPFNQALASTYLATLHQLCSDRAAARTSAEKALALTSEYKAPYYHAWSAILVIYAEAWEQPDAAAIVRLRNAIEDFKASGARLRLPYYLWLVARVQTQAGQTEEALATLDEALAVSRAHNERWWDAELHRLRGELMLARGLDDYDVEAALLRSLQVARAQEARSLELRAAMSLAKLWSAENRAEDARRLLAEVYGWFTEGFDTPDLLAASLLLVRLA